MAEVATLPTTLSMKGATVAASNLQKTTFVLVGPYAPDHQRSMERYAHQVETVLAQASVKTVPIRPHTSLARLPWIPSRARKLLAFVDKFVRFPSFLGREVSRLKQSGPVLVHILDQGNSLYSRELTNTPVVVTCHDLIAAKASFSGSGSRLGREFHKRNVAALQSANFVIGVSDKALADCRECFAPQSRRPDMRRVYNALDPAFETPSAPPLRPVGPPFLLHVGNSAWYKNRLGLFHIYAELRRMMPEAPPLRVLGAPLTGGEAALLDDLSLRPFVQIQESPSDQDLLTAYTHAEALVFPSLEEGFGWPPLEAMASGCPVFASNRPPLTEIGGPAFEYIDPVKHKAAAGIIHSCLALGTSWHAERALTGRLRAADFSFQNFTSNLLATYEVILASVETGGLLTS